ncbi:uncharacterized protein LOC112566538 [Pomacea canaliculata]|uniref:uncharacterized protein LOC112566538 n=1 Tax=Pomacea canaliculata TaxID=400727 RepID=UPI000D73EB25|nr:uncharacterized protein LOC112566538 [Pomacea canaliculata]
MAVFYKLGLRERINTCLFILSFVDLLYLAFACLLYGERAFALSPSHPRYGSTFRFAVENHFYGLYGVAWATAFVSVVIASERCFCIYFPLRAQNFIKTKTMAIFLALSCIFITLGFYVVSEKYNMICVYDVERNVTFWQLITTTSYYVQHRNLVDIFDSTVYGFCLPAIFNVTVAACSVAMILKLKKTLSWRDKASSAMSTKEALLTKMLVCLSIQYNIFSSPNFCIRSAGMFESGLSGSGKYFNTFMLMVSVVEICSFLNSSIPFFVYYFVGSKYRETLQGLFKSRREISRKTTLYSTNSLG